jgi:hypothetical protein
VFQLGPNRVAAHVHPMAFEFPTRQPSWMFFPTVHVHDGAVHPTATFAHRLYAQGVERETAFQISHGVASTFVTAYATGGVIAADQRVSMRELMGTYSNQDSWVAL